MTPLGDLPVWSFRTNWSDGVTESLIWQTSILAGGLGIEQRRALRLSPRRTIEQSVLLADEHRTFYDLALHRLGGAEWLFPLCYDIGRTTAALAVGATFVPCDTQFREFEVGGFALIQSNSPFVFDRVEIISIEPDGLTIEAPGVGHAWPRHSRVLPTRRGRLQPDQGYLKHTSKVAATTFRVDLIGPQDWLGEVEGGPVYLGDPIFLDRPNLTDTLDNTFSRQVLVADNTTGIPYQKDMGGRAFVGQAHRWYLHGRAKQAAFRDLLYRQRGKQRGVWLPTFNDDMRIATQGDGGANLLIEQCGYSYVGGPASGRDHVSIHLRDGSVIARKVVAAALAPNGREKLTFDGALGPIDPKAVKRISFLDYARLDQDQVDLVHHTDTDGMTEVNAVWRTIPTGRDPSGTIYAPIPAAQKIADTCGTPEPGACTHSFEGWYWALYFTIMRDDGDTQEMNFFGMIPGGPEIPFDLSTPRVVKPWVYRCLSRVDAPKGTGLGLQMQFGGSFLDKMHATELFAPGTDDNRPAAYISMQHWTYDKPITIARVPIGRLYPYYYGDLVAP